MVDSAVQPVLSSATRAVQLLEELGESSPGVLAALGELSPDADASRTRGEIDRLLGPVVLIEATIDEYGATHCVPGPATPALVQHGWRSFLVKVINPHGIRAELAGGAPGVLGVIARDPSAKPYMTDRPRENFSTVVEKLWLEAKLASPGDLSGIPAEYKVVSLYARDSGRRSIALHFYAAEARAVVSLTRQPAALTWMSTIHESGTYEATFEFDVAPSRDVVFDIREADGRTSMAALTVRDAQGRVYPSKGMRLAPDMVFQEHVYRAAGEVIRLPEGTFEVTAQRGPEYRPVRREVVLGAGTGSIDIVLDRWIDPAEHGYYSGDPHIHGGGCSHYNSPTEGVAPETMIRQVRGEGLGIGSVLTWGPCYYHQKQFFSGETISPPAGLEHPAMQAAQGMDWDPQPTAVDAESMLRYDIEVSGFPSSHSGHVILLGLTDQDYPGTSWLEDWPSWNLPVHRWASAQGALTGYAHCGLGLGVGTEDLPNYIVPSFNSIGSNELIVDVPNGLGDFQAGAEFSPAAELNIWYHLLNVGYRTLMMGETDFPCVYDEGPGVGRTYVRLAEPLHGSRALETWLEGLQQGSSYFGDGRSHVFDVAVDGDQERSQTRAETGPARVTATVAAWLPAQQPAPLTTGGSRYSAPVGWHLERARLGESREVLVEVVVNGSAVSSQRIVADGSEHRVAFDIELPRSSWVALRILRSVHTQPTFIEIGDRPVRASRRSAQWLHDSVDALWNEKHPFIRDAERPAAREAYEAAKAVYLERLGECEAD